MKSKLFNRLCEVARNRYYDSHNVDVVMSSDGTITIYSDDFHQDMLKKFLSILNDCSSIYSVYPLEVNNKLKVAISVCPF